MSPCCRRRRRCMCAISIRLIKCVRLWRRATRQTQRARSRQTLKLFGNALFVAAHGLIALVSPASSAHRRTFGSGSICVNYRVFCGDDTDIRIRSISRVHLFNAVVPKIRDGRIVFVTVFHRTQICTTVILQHCTVIICPNEAARGEESVQLVTI